MTTIFVCGTSEIKLKAVQEWVDEKGFNYQVKSIKVSTNLFGFPEQPMELHEGEGLGLMRIALSILELKDEFKNGDLIVSFENYITKEFEKEYSCFEYQDKCICQVRSWSGFQTIGFSKSYLISIFIFLIIFKLRFR